MSDFIADRMHLFLGEVKGPVGTATASGPTRAILSEASTLYGEIEGRALYAFERSALNAAADLRIDTPDRLDRLTEAVLNTPRRIFLECRGSDRDVVAANLRGVLDTRSRQPEALDRIQGYGERWGAFIDVLGQGRLRFRGIYTRPKSYLRNGAPAAIANLVDQAPKPLRPALERALAFDVSPAWTSLDTHRRVGMSKTEFDQALQRMSGGDEIFNTVHRLLHPDIGPRDRTSLVDAGWRLMRFRDLLRQEPIAPSNGQSLLHTLSSLTYDHASLALQDGILIIALLAVLEADSADIRRTPRASPTPRAALQKGKRVQSRPQLAPGLSVVTLNLEDRDLHALYSGRTSTLAPSPSETGAAGTPRVRHPVRGHLFLARSGKFVWRRPHWRGSLEKAQIHRVIAPSHKAS